MVNELVTYPVFRKYDNNRSFFKVLSPNEFIEIQRMGNTYFKYEMTAKILPDFHLINDMVSLHNGHWLEISELEFLEVFKAYQDFLPVTKEVG